MHLIICCGIHLAGIMFWFMTYKKCSASAALGDYQTVFLSQIVLPMIFSYAHRRFPIDKKTYMYEWAVIHTQVRRQTQSPIFSLLQANSWENTMTTHGGKQLSNET